MEALFNLFLKEKQYLSNVSPKTIRSYQQAFNCYTKLGGQSPTKDDLKNFVVRMREAGLSVGGCNVYIRSINSFLTWLHEGGQAFRKYLDTWCYAFFSSALSWLVSLKEQKKGHSVKLIHLVPCIGPSDESA
jgi:hypothetical protein